MKNTASPSRHRHRRRKHGNRKLRPTLLAVALLVVVVIWIMGAIYITISTAPRPTPLLNTGKMISPPHLPGLLSSHDEINENHTRLRRGGAPQQQQERPKITIDETNVIDMRNLTATLPFDDPDGGVWKQGWDVKPQDGPLTVFVVPHSHCDPGWVKTFSEYFQSQTKQILTTVITALAKNPKRKFIWAEISYFEWWWREQSPKMQETTRKLLRNKQFEFVTGGWVQPDEANTQLYAMEVQLQEGHDFIEKTFGREYIPKYGWSIDPFGYSPTMAYLLHKYNFQAMLIQRVHYAVKKELAQRQHLEFMWRYGIETSQLYGTSNAHTLSVFT